MITHAAVITVSAGGDLQGAILAAQPGDTIILEAGATFTGTFHLPLKSGNEYITIQSSRIDELPAGQRVTPGQSYLMPKIVTPGLGNPALHTVPGAHHFRILGIEFAPADADTFTYELITLGFEGEAQDSYDEVPHDLSFDRCYIHAFPQQTLKRGITLNSAHTEITNSHISGFKADGQDTQAILGWNGPGPFRIINNYLEASGENVMFGAGDPSIANLVPSDIEIRRNYFSKPLEWRGIWMVKNLLELKNAQRVTIDGNVFENCWSSGQNGTGIVLTPRNQYGGAPWSVVQDIQFVNNIVRHVANAFQITGHDDLYYQTTRSNNITIRNNVFEDVSASWTSTGQTRFLTITDTLNVTIDHNTIFQEKSVMFGFGSANTNFRFTNNISPYGEGIQGDGTSVGNGAVATYFPGATITANILVGGGTLFWDGIDNHYPLGNFYPATMQAIGFVNYNGGVGGNYRLQPSSPYVSTATDGSSLGANIDILEAAQAGNSTTPTTTPTTTPSPTPTPTITPTLVPTLTTSEGGYSVTVTAFIKPGESVTADWTAPEGHVWNDWITIYHAGASAENFGAWSYLGSATSGTANFVVPEAGQYEIRIYRADGFELLVPSQVVTVSYPTPPASDSPALLSNDFSDNSLSTPQWRRGLVAPVYGNFSLPISEVNGQLILSAISKSGYNYSGIASAKTFDFTGRAAQVELVKPLNMRYGASSGLTVGIADGLRVVMYVSNGFLYLYNSGPSGNTGGIPYDPVQHRWLSIRHDAATDTFRGAVSSDGKTWTDVFVVPRDFPINNITVDLHVGTDDYVNLPGSAIFDNFRLD